MRRFDKSPLAAISNALSRPANDAATMSVALSGATTIPLGKSKPSATWRTAPSDVMSAMIPLGLPADQEVEAESIPVDVAPTVDNHLVPAVLGDAAQVSMRHHRSIEFLAQHRVAGDEQPAVEEVEWPAQPLLWTAGHHLAAAAQVDCHNFARPPMSEPRPAVMPASELDVCQVLQ